MNVQELMALSEKAESGKWNELDVMGAMQGHGRNMAFILAAVNFIRSPEFAEMVKNDARWRWLCGQNAFLLHYEDVEWEKHRVNLRCGLPLDNWADALIAELAAKLAAHGQGEGNG